MTRTCPSRLQKKNIYTFFNDIYKTYSGSYPTSSEKHRVGSDSISGCLATTCWYNSGGRELTMNVCKHMVHFLAQASCLALLLAALRSSSVFPNFFWFRSRAALAF
uniref:Uncharacterized protein n=1 Tax=Pseudo-nitzschia australis TaxID=44445 RepID=A0A7S4AAV6_9STRA